MLGVRLSLPPAPLKPVDRGVPRAGILAELRKQEWRLDEETDAWVGGRSVGLAGVPDPFYLLCQYFFFSAKDEEFDKLVNDESAAVRAMVAVCLVSGDHGPTDWRLDKLKDDPARLTVTAYGCVGTYMSLGEFVAKLRTDAAFLSYFHPRGWPTDSLLKRVDPPGDPSANSVP